MFEAYKVAVRLSLVSNVASGLAALAGQFRTLNDNVNTSQKSVAALEAKLLQIKRLGLLGGAMAAAGGFGLSLFKGPLEEAKLFQLEIAKFRALGIGEAVTQDAVKFAKGMDTYGTSVRENLSLLRDAQTVLGDFEHAKGVAPLLAQMKFANTAMYGGEGADTRERAFMDMLKVIELRKGLVSEDAFRRQANMVQQVITATGGRVGASEYLQLIKTGGVAAKGISDDVFYYKLEPLIQEMGGMRVGTGLMSAYQNLMLGRTTVQVAKELNSLGLLDPKHVEYNKIGMIKRVLPGGLKGGDVLARDPVEFLETVLLPAFAKKGITSEQGVLQELGLIFSNRTASSLFSTIFLQMANIKKNEALNRGAMTIDQLTGEAKNTALGKEIELQKKWKDVLNELGTAVLPIAIKAVEGLTVAVKAAVAFAREFPVLTKGLTIAFGVLSGLVAAGGVVMLATSAFKALGLALAFSGVGGIGGAAGIMRLALAFTGPAGLIAALVALGIFVAKSIDASKVKNKFQDISPGYKRPGDSSNPDSIRTPAGEAAREALRKRLGLPEETVKPAAANKSGQKQGDIYMDGRKVGEIVTQHQSKEAARPMSGTTRVDPTMTRLPAGGSLQMGY